MSPSEKISKLNQELILDRVDLLQLSLCDNNDDLEYLIDLMKNHNGIRKPKRIESFDFEKAELIEDVN